MAGPVPGLIEPGSGDAVQAFEAAHRVLVRGRRWQMLLFGVVFALALAASVVVGEVSITVLLDGLPALFNYLGDITPVLRLAHLGEDLGEWYWNLGPWLGLLWDTLLIAFLGTFLGLLGALLLCFPASRNLVAQRWLVWLARRLAEFARAVPELVYALIFVFSFGIGPFAGVLAIAIHTSGALAKLFAEVNENIDDGPLEGLRASGANWLEMIRFAVLPQVLPNFTSYTLLRFEINVRGAAVIGFVGAGGIGQELMLVIRQFIYPDISALVLLIVATVIIIDMVCETLRHRLIGAEKLL